MQMFCLLFSKKVEVLNKGGLKAKKGDLWGSFGGLFLATFPVFKGLSSNLGVD